MHSLSVLNFGDSPLKFWNVALTQFLVASVEMPEVQRCGTPVDDPNIIWGNSSSIPLKQCKKFLTLITLKAGCLNYWLLLVPLTCCIFVFFWKGLVPDSWWLVKNLNFHLKKKFPTLENNLNMWTKWNTDGEVKYNFYVEVSTYYNFKRGEV